MLALVHQRANVMDLEVVVAAVLLQTVGLLVVDNQVDLQIAQLCQLVALFNQIFLPLALDRLPAANIHD